MIEQITINAPNIPDSVKMAEHVKQPGHLPDVTALIVSKAIGVKGVLTGGSREMNVTHVPLVTMVTRVVSTVRLKL